MESSDKRKNRLGNKVRVTILLTLVGWTYLYNIVIKDHNIIEGFFKIIDTISDEFVMGSLLTVLVGTLIVTVFSITKLYTQLISNVYSYRILEIILDQTLWKGDVRSFFKRLLHFESEDQPATFYPQKTSALLFSFALIFLMSWIYIILFSEALFFIPWSAGVDLPINEKNLLLLPTLALAIPFSARVMAYLKYPYAQDYADFMPGGVFVLLLVVSLGYLFQSEDQKFFLLQVYENKRFLLQFAKNGLLLAFIPVFFEGIYWLVVSGLNNEDRS